MKKSYPIALTGFTVNPKAYLLSLLIFIISAGAVTAQTTTLAPIADAFVRSATYATTNYGNSTSLEVKATTTAGSSYNRISYLKFSLSSVSTVVSAKLRIYGSNTQNTSSVSLSAYGVDDDSWTESGITWNNAPAASTSSLSSTGVTNTAKYYELDVTNYVLSQLSGDKVVTLVLKNPSNQNIGLDFNSRENTTNHPQLIITTSATTLAPIADAFVRSATYANINYGSDPSLVVKATATAGSSYNRVSYLKFSLNSVSTIASAKLRIYGYNTENTQSINLSAFGVDDDSWTESGITWNNAPAASSTALSSVGVNNTAKYYELDVTNYVLSQLNGDKVVTLALKNPSNQNINLAFNSRENTVNKPELIITASGTENKAPVFSSNAYTYSLVDTVAVSTRVGTVTANDPDGDALTYTIISGNTNKDFAINASTGAITVAKVLNYHTQDKYILTVRAADAGGLFDEASVTVNITRGTIFPDFTTITWGTAASQPYGTTELHGEVVNKKLYAFGGYDVLKQPTWTPTKRSYMYDPGSNKWTAIADLPHTPKGSGFGGVTHEGLATDGTDIYFAGGYVSNSDGTGQVFSTTQVWKYNVATNTYTALPGLPEPYGAGQLRYLKGKLHFFGGANKSRVDVTVHYALDLDNLSAGWKALAPLSDGRNHAGSAVYAGKIYSIGGSHHQDDEAVTQKIVEVYDPQTDTWTRAADMPIGLDHISSAVVVMGDRIIVFGGETSHNVRSNRVLAYSPANNTWTDLTHLPASKSAGIAVELNNVLYYVGGNFSKTVYKGVPGEAQTQKVSSFTLINADTDQPIQTISDGSTLNLATLPTRHLNIVANTSPTTIGSVVFNLSGQQIITITENIGPYALFGDDMKGDYSAWTPTAGSYTLKATPYSASKGTGTAGTALTVSFTVIDQAAILDSSANDTLASRTGNEQQGLLMYTFPNPSAGSRVRVIVENLAPGEKATLLLMNMIGQVVEVDHVVADGQGNISTTLTHGTRLLPGLYMLQLQGLSGKTTSKLVVK